MESWTLALEPGPSNLASLSARCSGFWPRGACYYLATRIAWVLCFPDSKVSLFFPPHAVLVSILLLVPTRHWWAYTLAAAGSHFFATQQAALAASLCAALRGLRCREECPGGRRDSHVHQVTVPSHQLREAILFVLIAVIIVPFGTAFWGAAFTVSNDFGTHYWVEWRNLGISNGVTAIVLVPVILIGVHQLSARGFKAAPEAHPGSMPPGRGHSRGRIRRLRSGACGTGHVARAPLCTRSPAHLGGPPLRAWRHQRLHAGHHDPGDLGNDAGTRAVPDADPLGKRSWPCSCSS